MESTDRLPLYRQSLAGNLLAAREAVMEPLRPILRSADLTEQQWRILRVLNDSGPSDPTSLAVEGLLYPPSVARILQDLAERKFIVRRSDPSDGRRKVIVITQQGRHLVEHTADKVFLVLARFTKVFGKKRLAALQAELIALARTVNESTPASD